ncbi:phage holin family protein [Puniceicoccus vermicola]|uniref:Phage holin family protein n=1 Tax=Puniceicoccus vermicola TaxID=388746 RepID=A0A7X1B3S1_9BACT|nr:phage holin family protein [Puniceicoccus vermicola]MBC2603870.1 phage holin family protein [Puniceicoccus vermicola]
MNPKLLKSFSRLVSLRLDIFLEEVRLVKMRTVRVVSIFAVAFVLAQLCLASLLALGIALTEGPSRIWFLSIVAGSCFLLVVILVLLAIRMSSGRLPPFAVTKSEFKKDKECLESAFKN